MYDFKQFLEKYQWFYSNNVKAINSYLGYIENNNNNSKTMLEFVSNNKLETISLLSGIATRILKNLDKASGCQKQLLEEYIRIADNVVSRNLGKDEKPIYSEDKKDKRFRNKMWQEDMTFNYLLQSYICNSMKMKEFFNDILKEEDESKKRKINFYVQQVIDAISPTNCPITNPDVIEEALETKGESILKGYNNFIESLDKDKGIINLKTTNYDSFAIGKNIACTKGQVIYQNDVMELIQYNPVCENVYSKPILIIPAWINKFYILDLSEKNSFIRWLVSNGFTVFTISWCNTIASIKNKEFQDYMLEGSLKAIEVVEDITGSKEINAIGYCLGGTLLAITLAYMKAKNDNRIISATFIASMLDFSEVGNISCFIDEQSLEKIEKMMEEIGYFEGSQMSTVFSLLKPNDLIWSFFINNYFLGKEPLAFDMLYWNSDSTCIPSKVHSFYLRNMYLYNNLVKPGAISLDGVSIDISKVDIPCYVLSTKEDHISPWKTTYKTLSMVSGSSRFVLADSGHVAGVINHPSRNKYCYWANDLLKEGNPQSSDKWLEDSVRKEGSWWLDWKNWNLKYNNEKIPKISIGSKKHKSLSNAPGTYVMTKSS